MKNQHYHKIEWKEKDKWLLIFCGEAVVGTISLPLCTRVYNVYGDIIDVDEGFESLEEIKDKVEEDFDEFFNQIYKP